MSFISASLPLLTLPPPLHLSPLKAAPIARWQRPISSHQSLHQAESNISDSTLYGEMGPKNYKQKVGRREISMLSIGIIVGAFWNVSNDGVALAAQFADMPALRGKDYGKTKMRYPDYTETESGLQFKDLRAGNGPTPKRGETVVVDWDGYTIGYYGRIFEARNKTKGGSFEGDDKDFYKFKLGSREVIPAFEEAVSGMALGGIRRLLHSDAGS